jgi:hypothetical protein
LIRLEEYQKIHSIDAPFTGRETMTAVSPPHALTAPYPYYNFDDGWEDKN